jgi:hypothetical protein
MTSSAASSVVATDTTLLYASRAKLAKLCGIALLFGAVGVAMEFSHEVALTYFAGPLSIVFGLLGLAATVRLALTARRPIVAFEREGVSFRGPAEMQYLAWSDLSLAYVVSVSGQRFVALRPVDTAAAIASAGPLRQRAMRMSVEITGAPFNLPTATGLAPEALLAIVARYAPHAV